MFGLKEARPVLQDPLVAQRNPFEVYLLSVGALLGFLRLAFDFKTSNAIDTMDPVVVAIWTWLVTVGCFVGLIALSLPNKHIENGLALERFALTVVGFGILVYSGVVLGSTGMVGVWTASTNAAFAFACLTRAVQISRRFRWADDVERHREQQR